ncbi:MAG: DUF308 domain-containing protein [Lachnospiraceae bacterium]|nr:DUF308 domain-containing protein [Lachnospiraceae bacterium]
MFDDIIEKLKSIRLHITISALACVIMGVVFLIWPSQVTNLIAYVVGALLVAIGAIQVVSKIINEENRSSGLLVGALILIIGIWIIVHPQTAVSLIPIVIGVVLVVSGVQELSLAFTAKNVDSSSWGWMIAGAVLTIVFGIICVCVAFNIVTIAMRLLGLFLIYDGVSSMLMVHHVNVAERVVDTTITKEEDVDDFF